MGTKTQTTISVNGGPDVPIDLAMAAADKILGKRNKPSGELLGSIKKTEILAKIMCNQVNKLIWENAMEIGVALDKEVIKALAEGGAGLLKVKLECNLTQDRKLASISQLSYETRDSVKKQSEVAIYDPNQPELPFEGAEAGGDAEAGAATGTGRDEVFLARLGLAQEDEESYLRAVNTVKANRKKGEKISVSWLQRVLKLSYTQAANLYDTMLDRGDLKIEDVECPEGAPAFGTERGEAEAGAATGTEPKKRGSSKAGSLDAGGDQG